MTDAPRTLEELRKVSDPAARALAAGRYVAAGEAKLAEARALRDAAILELIGKIGATATARECGVSLSHVKAVRRAAR